MILMNKEKIKNKEPIGRSALLVLSRLLKNVFRIGNYRFVKIMCEKEW